MDAMKGFPDGYFDLALVDPPYGGGGEFAGGGNQTADYAAGVRTLSTESAGGLVEYFQTITSVLGI
ncbi:MAG: hypothetical protein RSB86_18220 [Comamonas sp.]|uniref:hypothetical protein n=1 Tax=Comamonas sp. TaxID=34028 RepID=UPI002FC9C59E